MCNFKAEHFFVVAEISRFDRTNVYNLIMKALNGQSESMKAVYTIILIAIITTHYYV